MTVVSNLAQFRVARQKISRPSGQIDPAVNHEDPAGFEKLEETVILNFFFILEHLIFRLRLRKTDELNKTSWFFSCELQRSMQLLSSKFSLVIPCFIFMTISFCFQVPVQSFYNAQVQTLARLSTSNKVLSLSMFQLLD